MAWFLNHYVCAGCHLRLSDNWSCMCDHDCPHCGARHMSPYNSEDLTTLIVPDGDVFVVLRSSDEAEHDPDYRELARTDTRANAETFLTDTTP